jgi:hypothetical protein
LSIIISPMNTVQIANTDADILKCWEVIYCLRPHLLKENFLNTIHRMQRQGYMLVFIERDGKAAVAAGFEIGEKLYIVPTARSSLG